MPGYGQKWNLSANSARRTKETLIPKWPIMMLEAWNWVAKAFKGQLDLIVF